jgi:hypothetical protein
MARVLQSLLWRIIAPSVQAVITDRLLDFYEGLIERGQIEPSSVQILASVGKAADGSSEPAGAPASATIFPFPDRLTSEREARHKLEAALRSKDAAMQTLFDRLRSHGDNCEDLIP